MISDTQLQQSNASLLCAQPTEQFEPTRDGTCPASLPATGALLIVTGKFHTVRKYLHPRTMNLDAERRPLIAVVPTSHDPHFPLNVLSSRRTHLLLDSGVFARPGEGAPAQPRGAAKDVGDSERPPGTVEPRTRLQCLKDAGRRHHHGSRAWRQGCAGPAALGGRQI